MDKYNCEHPERKPKDGNCDEDLIEKCHGKDPKHPCKEDDKKDA